MFVVDMFFFRVNYSGVGYSLDEKEDDASGLYIPTTTLQLNCGVAGNGERTDNPQLTCRTTSLKIAFHMLIATNPPCILSP